jgi:hypothetical protein
MALTTEKAQRRHRALSRWLIAVLLLIASAWTYASVEIWAVASTAELATVLVEASPGVLPAFIVATVIIGFGWMWALSSAAIALWGPVGGVLATAAVFALQRAFTFSTLIFAVYLLYRLRKVAPVPADQTAVTVDEAAGRAARTFATIATILFFLLPFIAFIATVAIVWRQEATEDWHWLAKLPLSVVLGGVMGWMTSLATMSFVGFVSKRS